MVNPPQFKGFKPIGSTDENIPVVLNYEEYESIRLSDYELMGQVEAATFMDVSRPTYTRIYESARRKVAQAFVLGKAIVFEGGKVYFDSEWYECRHCGCLFNHPEKELVVSHCALCGSTRVEQYHTDEPNTNLEDVCFCSNCGLEVPHNPGKPCRDESCPVCHAALSRKGVPYRHRKRIN